MSLVPLLGGTGGPLSDHRVSDARTARRAEQRERRREKQNRVLMIAGVTATFILMVTLVAWLVSPLLGASGTTAATPMPSTDSPTETAAATPVTAPPVPTPAPAIQAAPPPPPDQWSSTRIGTSVKGESIDAYRFGTGPKRILILGGVHGDEYGAEAAEQMITRLQDNPGLVPAGTEIHIIPSLNPDGRKASSRGNANGVDINRNMPSRNWSSELDPKDSSGARGLKGGNAPASEPESQAFIDYLGKDFASIVSLHSKGGLVDYDGPGGDALAKKVAAACGLPAKHLGYQPYITGSMGIYVPEKYGIPVITIELNSPRLTDKMAAAILVPASE